MANPAVHTPGPAGRRMPPQGGEKNWARCVWAPNAPSRNGLRGIVLASMRLGARPGFRHRCGKGETLGCPRSLEAAVVPIQASALGRCRRQVRAAVRSGVRPIRSPRGNPLGIEPFLEIPMGSLAARGPPRCSVYSSASLSCSLTNDNDCSAAPPLFPRTSGGRQTGDD